MRHEAKQVRPKAALACNYYNVCIKVCLCYYMQVCLCYIIYLYVCTNEDVYTLYVYMQTCCWLQEVQVGVMHYITSTFCNLFTLQLMCEKDVGMGLCTFNFVLRLSLHLVCLLFGTSSLHLLKFF